MVTTADLRSLVTMNYPNNTSQEIDAADLRGGFNLVADLIDFLVGGSARVYPSRQAAVDDGPIPVNVAGSRIIITLENDSLVVRRPGWAANDPLFESYPNWGVLFRTPNFTDLAQKADLINSGKTFRSREEAVEYGQDNLPSALRMIATVEDDGLVLRTPGQSSIGDNLFDSYPHWGRSTTILPSREVVDGLIGAFARDATLFFYSRDGAVSSLPTVNPETRTVWVAESGNIVLRGRTSTSDPLFEGEGEYPWGVVETIRARDIGYLVNADRPTGQNIPTDTQNVTTRNGVQWRRDPNQDGPEDETHAFSSEGVRYFKIQQSGADHRASPPLPGLRRSTDASYALHEFMDMAGGLHLAGLDGSVQENFRRVRQRLDALRGAGGSAAFDAVTEFGIDNTGSTNAAPAINAALRALAARPYPTALVLPAGDYMLSQRIAPVSGVSIIGANRDTVRLLPNTHNPAFSYFYTQNDGAYLEGACFGNFTIDGENQTLNPSGGYAVGTKGMYFHGFKDCLFTDFRILNTGATGLGIDFPDRSIIQRVIADNCGRNGHLVEQNIAGASGIGIGTGHLETEMLLIADCYGMNCYNYGIFVEMQGVTHSQYLSRGYVITGCTMRGNRWGFGEDGGDGTILSNCLISDNLEAGVKLSTGTFITQARPGLRLTMSGNEIFRNGGPGVIYEGAAKSGLAGYQSRGNRIHDNAGAGHEIVGSTAEVIDGWQIDDLIHNNGSDGISVSGGQGFTNVDIRGTMLENTGAAIRLDADINGGRIFGATMRDLRSTVAQVDSIVGSGLLTNFDISEVQGVGCGPMDLTNPGNSVTTGRNVGI